jgi:hypothetical protein
MIRSACIFLAFLSLIIVPAQAIELHDSGISFSKSDLQLVKSSFSTGRVALDIFAESRVEVANLLADLDLSRSATAEDIAGRVNEARKRLYPEEEIILSITPPQNSRAAVTGEKAGLVKAIYWWNNTNCSSCYWSAEYSSTVATVFISDIQYGAYNIYDKVGSGNYIARVFVDEGDSAARTSYGSKTARGFRGYADGVSSRADIVLYFFK